MASRASSALVLLAIFAAALSLQVALADEAGSTAVVTGWKAADVGSDMSPPVDTEVEESTELHEDHGMNSEVDQLANDDLDQGSDDVVDTTGGGEIQPYVYVPSADELVELTPASTATELGQGTRVAGEHPLARILSGYAPTKCWSSRHCQHLVKSGACCNKRCADLSSSNTNCGRCNKACDTRRGYFCRSCQCVKPPSSPTCAVGGRCRGGKICCRGHCLSLQNDASNCGRCGRTCPFGSACCGGHCKQLKSDGNNCGQCGRWCGRGTVCCNGQCLDLKSNNGNCGACGMACGYGRVCCNGQCVGVITDKNNCGRCGKKCGKNVKCKFGICGYGQ